MEQAIVYIGIEVAKAISTALLTFAASSRLMATAQASPRHAATSTCR
jgi:hypothetical protein